MNQERARVESCHLTASVPLLASRLPLRASRFAPPASRQSFPQSLEIHRAERAVVQTVSWPATLSPYHPPVVRAHGTGESRLTQRAQHLEHVDAAELRRMGRFMKLTRAGHADIATVREMNPPARAESTYHRREIVLRRDA